MLIQVDVDSTLYDANKLFYDIGTEEFGIAWPKKYYTWFTAEDIGTDLGTLKKVFRMCHSKEVVAQQKPYKNAAGVLGNLVSQYEDAEIAYVSDRNEAQSSALEEWLDAHGFLHGEDQKIVVSRDKRDWMRQHRPSIVIDDRVRTLLMARYELNAYGVTLEHPHNLNLKGEAEGIFVCDDWLEIGQVIESEIVPRVGTKATAVR